MLTRLCQAILCLLRHWKGQYTSVHPLPTTITPLHTTGPVTVPYPYQDLVSTSRCAKARSIPPCLEPNTRALATTVIHTVDKMARSIPLHLRHSGAGPESDDFSR
eukprot:scpid108090/ scgid23131/ 